MQLNEVPAKTGYLWLRRGIGLFRRNPPALLTALLFYLLAIVLVSQLPLLGPMLAMVSAPGLSLGLITACRDAMAGKPVLPTVLIAGFRENGSGVAKQLLQLGLLYMLAGMLMLTISVWIAGDAMLPWQTLTHNSESRGNSPALPLSVLLSLIAYMPVSMLFWFAPILCAWHRVPPFKALFFSFVACWRNRGAFLCYIALWVTVAIAMSLITVLIAQLARSEALGIGVLLPLSAVFAAVLYGSHYASYQSCFGIEEQKE